MKRCILFKIVLAVLVLLMLLCAVSCSQVEENGDNTSEPVYCKVDAAYAKGIMDSGKEYVLLDTRTESEYAEGHIEGAILVPEYEIEKRAPELLKDKNMTILVYCRTGRRSKIASEALVDMGYTNVMDFGGIVDWPYEIVK